ncbi:MAG: hypothetical protein Q4C81_04155 [Kocuria sp.]|nr:hypothetical protein [Kocuria sp.]
MSITPVHDQTTDLSVGDKVLVKRVLDHPAWMKQVPCDPRSGSDTKLVRDPEVVEELGTSTVLDRREVPAVAGGWGVGADRPAKTLVRLPSGFWYDCATGLQDGSGATRIERAAS